MTGTDIYKLLVNQKQNYKTTTTKTSVLLSYMAVDRRELLSSSNYHFHEYNSDIIHLLQTADENRDQPLSSEARANLVLRGCDQRYQAYLTYFSGP